MSATGFMQTRIAPAINDRLRVIPSWSVYLAGSLPAIWYFWLGFNAQLGPNPISKLEHLLGEFALQLLIIGLAITPLRRLTYINLLKFRRAIGLLAFFYVLLHLLVWLVLDIQILSQILADILKRPYITVGMVAFAAMLPLALTSNQWSLRKLGLHWHRLHKLTYSVCILACVHFIMLRKGFQLEPLVYLGLIAILLVFRLNPKTKQSR